MDVNFENTSLQNHKRRSKKQMSREKRRFVDERLLEKKERPLSLQAETPQTFLNYYCSPNKMYIVVLKGGNNKPVIV